MITFAVLPDVQVGRVKSILNWWDYFIPHSKDEVVGIEIEKRLRQFVEKVNDSDAEFVMSVGDFTDTATKEQFKLVKEIMKGIKKPWVPLLGNHDAWPYSRDEDGKVTWNAEGPITFGEFKTFFKEEFEKISQFFENWEEQKGWLGNFAFYYHGIKFIVADNVNRRKSPFRLPGAAGWSKLYPESKEWLFDQIIRFKDKQIVIVSHAPLELGVLELVVEGKMLKIAGHRHKYRVTQKKKITSVVTNALYVEAGFPSVMITENGTPLIEFQKL